MAAAEPSVFSGQDFSLQRDKNRFVLPPQFRKTLKALGGDTLKMTLVKHDRWDCLRGKAIGQNGRLQEGLREERALAAQSREAFDADRKAIDTFTFEEVPFDGSGRFIMPDTLCAVANIDDQIYFQGGGDFFLIWAPEEMYRMDESWRHHQTICRRLAERELKKAGRA